MNKVTVLVIVCDGDLTISVYKNPRGAYAGAIYYYNSLESSYPGDWDRLFDEWEKTNDLGTEGSLWEMIEEYAGRQLGDKAEVFEHEEVNS